MQYPIAYFIIRCFAFSLSASNVTPFAMRRFSASSQLKTSPQRQSKDCWWFRSKTFWTFFPSVALMSMSLRHWMSKWQLQLRTMIESSVLKWVHWKHIWFKEDCIMLLKDVWKWRIRSMSLMWIEGDSDIGLRVNSLDANPSVNIDTVLALIICVTVLSRHSVQRRLFLYKRNFTKTRYFAVLY